ncbi:NHL repeat-containing protein 2 [Phytophthora pseudosyringae]|uniref:NHL repeat-containing protein 2 n=1 Tax=Phytophthora pseudosyringae TaxID=221518 RepID=A0A8T1VKC3_9STRA|nr:NHL repeat-containing protein 2 [Phytophthora pseudosyringae]
MARSARDNDERWIGSGRRGHVDGDARDAELNRPFGVCAFRNGTLAFTDTHNNAVRFVISETRRCGAMSKTRRRDFVKTAACSGLLTPKGIAASSDERHLFVCDTGHHRIKLAALPSRSALVDVGSIADGVEMFAFAGNGKKGWRDGAALEANFNSPAGVCEYGDGSIIVADTGNHCIRQIRRTVSGKLVVKTIVGAQASLEATRGGGNQRRHAERTANVPVGNRVSGYRDGAHSLF